MARTRNVKPATFTNDLLAEVEPLGRLLFIGLWCHADRAGRVLDRGKKLKAEILPYDDCDIENLLQQLEMRGFVVRYTVDQVQCIQVVTFSKHQNPHKKEPVSSLPAPPNNGPVPVITGLVPENPAPSGPSSLTLNPSSLNGELQSDTKPAPVESLDKYQIVTPLLTELRMANTVQNYRTAAASVELAMTELKCNPFGAYVYLLEQADICRADGLAIDYRWLNDGKFFPGNRTDAKVKLRASEGLGQWRPS